MSGCRFHGAPRDPSEIPELRAKVLRGPFQREVQSPGSCNNVRSHRCVEVLLEYAKSHREIEFCGDGPVVRALTSKNLDILRICKLLLFTRSGTFNH